VCSLDLILEDRAITVAPRDEESRAWLVGGGDIHTYGAMGMLRREWMNRGISRRDLPIMAAQLQAVLNRDRGGYERWADDGGIRRERVTFHVRACELADVIVGQQLREIRWIVRAERHQVTFTCDGCGGKFRPAEVPRHVCRGRAKSTRRIKPSPTPPAAGTRAR
jgi:hypothetical protein